MGGQGRPRRNGGQRVVAGVPKMGVKICIARFFLYYNCSPPVCFESAGREGVEGVEGVSPLTHPCAHRDGLADRIRKQVFILMNQVFVFRV